MIHPFKSQNNLSVTNLQFTGGEKQLRCKYLIDRTILVQKGPVKINELRLPKVEICTEFRRPMRRFFSLSAAFVPFPMVPKTKDHRAVGRKGGFKSLGSNLPANAYKGKGNKSPQLDLTKYS